MALRSAEWDVVIVGRWNRAILTPFGIRKHLFKFEEATQVRVLVPLDGLSPYLVGHPTQHIVVMTDEGRLRVQVEKPDYEALGHAMTAGMNALAALPETPVSAAGFNVNFSAKEATPQMAALLVSKSDSVLVTAGHKPVARTVGISLEHGAGRLNITMTGEGGGFGLSFNFHRGSEDAKELAKWLQTPVDQIEGAVNSVLGALGLYIEEVSDDANAE